MLRWMHEHFTETMIALTMAEVRKRVAARSKTADRELPDLQKQMAKLQREVERLGESLLATDSKPSVVVKMIAEREEQIREIDARIRAMRVAPQAIDLETRRNREGGAREAARRP